MALFREIDLVDRTVVFKHQGKPITPVMNMDDAKQLLEGLGDALEQAYLKARDNEQKMETWRALGRAAQRGE